MHLLAAPVRATGRSQLLQPGHELACVRRGPRPRRRRSRRARGCTTPKHRPVSSESFPSAVVSLRLSRRAPPRSTRRISVRAVDVAGGAGADHAGVLALRLEREVVVEGRDAEDLRGRNGEAVARRIGARRRRCSRRLPGPSGAPRSGRRAGCRGGASAFRRCPSVSSSLGAAASLGRPARDSLPVAGQGRAGPRDSWGGGLPVDVTVPRRAVCVSRDLRPGIYAPDGTPTRPCSWSDHALTWAHNRAVPGSSTTVDQSRHGPCYDT